jgi:putative glutathione S-transferase
MGALVEGEWRDIWYDTQSTGGKFIRQDAQFRHWIEDRPGARIAPEKGRYHLYVSMACPWAHRTLIFRKLKGLEDAILVSRVESFMGEQGWVLRERAEPLSQAQYMHEVYTASEPRYSGRVTVPVLWDRKEACIVSNESSEIIRMMNQAFDSTCASPGDFYPTHLRAQIDAVNERVYHDVNNGVYKTGFATTQEAYETALFQLFQTLDWLEEKLCTSRYLAGDVITEADWRLFTTLVRFDAVYVGHFKCNLRRIFDYPNLWDYLCELYQVPGIAETVDFTDIKTHYYASHSQLNPTGIVPAGPMIDLDTPNARPHTRPKIDKS